MQIIMPVLEQEAMSKVIKLLLIMRISCESMTIYPLPFVRASVRCI